MGELRIVGTGKSCGKPFLEDYRIGLKIKLIIQRIVCFRKYNGREK